MKIRRSILRLILGRRHLLHSIRKKRILLRQLPVPSRESTETMYRIPKAMTGRDVPLNLKPKTAFRLRGLLEDQVILEEQMTARMAELKILFSDSLKKKRKPTETI